MADKKSQVHKDSKKREELEQARREKGNTGKQVPYENRQLSPGRDGRTITR